MLISAPPMVFTHLQVKEAFPHLAFWELKSSPVGTRSRTGEGLGESPSCRVGRGSWKQPQMLTSMAFFPG